MGLSTSLIDLFDTVDSSVQTFELQKRLVTSSNIVEIIAIDVDLSGSGKCKRTKNKKTTDNDESLFTSVGMLDDVPKVTQLEDERFNRMQHFYGTDEIDPDTIEDLDLGDDGKVNSNTERV